eukprot:TRINITY_DN7369_c1_g1_i2.p1 TRINITY_DN7369_c1_g1~~TRINITY_DN7369_c1_g1_i2.p1  ORF type:complete len:302 (+),score=54.64 TRINITY_DN7369_c1_g1_i2:478-1383(+)
MYLLSFSDSKKDKEPEVSSSAIKPGPRKEELFVDIVEKMTLSMDGKGIVKKSAIDGEVRIQGFLQANPKIKIFFNDDLLVGRENEDGSSRAPASNILDYCTFHECCLLSNWESQKCLEFFLPDGQFNLFHYSLMDSFKSPFQVVTFIEEGPTPGKLDCVVKIMGLYPSDKTATEMVVTVQMPSKTLTAEIMVNSEKEETGDYVESERTIIWKIPKIQGGKESSSRIKLAFDASLPGDHKREIGPISISFQLRGYLSSSLQIKKVLVEKTGDPPKKFVRLLTQSKSVVAKIDVENTEKSVYG